MTDRRVLQWLDDRLSVDLPPALAQEQARRLEALGLLVAAYEVFRFTGDAEHNHGATVREAHARVHSARDRCRAVGCGADEIAAVERKVDEVARDRKTARLAVLSEFRKLSTVPEMTTPSRYLEAVRVAIDAGVDPETLRGGA